MGERRKKGAMPPTRLAAVFAAVTISVAPVAAAAAAKPPAQPQVTDPAGDANLLNDQHNSYVVGGPHVGDVAGPANLDDQADILAVWFTNDAKTITAHIRTTAPPEQGSDLMFTIDTNRTDRADGIHHGCTYFQIFMAEDANGEAWDYCVTNTRAAGTVAVDSFSDGTGHLTITAPRTLVPFLKGRVLTDPHADSRALVIEQTGHFLGFLDTTAEGSDYRLKG